MKTGRVMAPLLVVDQLMIERQKWDQEIEEITRELSAVQEETADDKKGEKRLKRRERMLEGRLEDLQGKKEEFNERYHVDSLMGVFEEDEEAPNKELREMVDRYYEGTRFDLFQIASVHPSRYLTLVDGLSAVEQRTMNAASMAATFSVLDAALASEEKELSLAVNARLSSKTNFSYRSEFVEGYFWKRVLTQLFQELRQKNPEATEGESLDQFFQRSLIRLEEGMPGIEIHGKMKRVELPFSYKVNFIFYLYHRIEQIEDPKASPDKIDMTPPQDLPVDTAVDNIIADFKKKYGITDDLGPILSTSIIPEVYEMALFAGKRVPDYIAENVLSYLSLSRKEWDALIQWAPLQKIEDRTPSYEAHVIATRQQAEGFRDFLKTLDPKIAKRLEEAVLLGEKSPDPIARILVAKDEGIKEIIRTQPEVIIRETRIGA
ncbi:MAG: hypothetical protein Q7S00_06810, partial [bacterium]|nr:hypothetical protein [bacterium]